MKPFAQSYMKKVIWTVNGIQTGCKNTGWNFSMVSAHCDTIYKEKNIEDDEEFDEEGTVIIIYLVKGLNFSPLRSWYRSKSR